LDLTEGRHTIRVATGHAGVHSSERGALVARTGRDPHHP
jgi:hypothetical protein